jgi:hypothetical protein
MIFTIFGRSFGVNLWKGEVKKHDDKLQGKPWEQAKRSQEIDRQKARIIP